jgi:hypothetical protein
MAFDGNALRLVGYRDHAVDLDLALILASGST